LRLDNTKIIRSIEELLFEFGVNGETYKNITFYCRDLNHFYNTNILNGDALYNKIFTKLYDQKKAGKNVSIKTYKYFDKFSLFKNDRGFERTDEIKVANSNINLEVLSQEKDIIEEFTKELANLANSFRDKDDKVKNFEEASSELVSNYKKLDQQINSLLDKLQNALIEKVTIILNHENFDKEKESIEAIKGGFTEIKENLKKASNELWGEGLESVSFWKAIRSIYQSKNDKHFSFCIVGTNPICIEYTQILHADNPIFKAVEPTYIQGFDRSQTREMIRTLGRVMGVTFDEPIYQKLTDEYGGHPFLIRHVCSYISQKNTKRPIKISKTTYESAKQEFNKQETEYFEMILGVLKEFYPNEYEMLRLLAMNDYETFNYFADEEPTIIKHLLGYGLVQKIEDDYEFKMEVMKEYIIRKEKLEVFTLNSIEDKWKYLAEERGKLEINLRKMIKQVLVIEQFKDASFNAKSYVIQKLHNNNKNKRKYGNFNINDLFNADKAEIYFNDLDKLVRGKWESFEQYMKDMDQPSFNHYMKVINKIGRADAHAKEKIDERDLQEVRLAFDKLNSIISNYNETPNDLASVFN